MDNSKTTPVKPEWYTIAREHARNQAYERSLPILDSAIKTTKHSLYLGHAHYLQGYIHYKQENYLASLRSYHHASEVYEQLGQLKLLSDISYNIGSIYEKNDLTEKALDNYLKAYRLQKDDPELEVKALNRIGLAYKDLEDYDQALNYYHEGLILAGRINDNRRRAIFMNNLCEAYRRIKDFENAEKYGLGALTIKERLGNEKSKALTLNNLALIYKETNQREKAKDFFLQSIEIHKKYDHFYLANSYNNLAELYIEGQDFEKADYYLNQALVPNNTEFDDHSYTLELKATIAKKQGKMEQWGRYLEQSLALKDSVHNKQNTIKDLSYNNLQLVQERVAHENTMHKARIDYQRQVNRWVTIAVVVALVGITVIAILYWRLRQATLTMDTYTKNMSHTMRNQFNAILGNAYIVKGLLRKMKVSPEEDTRPEAYEAIGSISDILQSSAETTTNIITTRHVGKVQAESDLYKPVQAVSANLKTYTPAAREKGIVLKEEVLSTPSVTAHATTFEHALGNLVSNAIKYSPEGSTVTIRLYDRDNRVFLTVLDEGPGIVEKDKKGLFKKGAKLHHIKNIVSSGVGLYYAKRDVEAMGGKMYHENRLEGGSVFTIEFPKTI